MALVAHGRAPHHLAMGMDRRAHWDAVYAQRRPNEVSWYQEHPERSLEVITTLVRDPAAAVIDVGGGSSRLVDGLSEAGFTDLTVLDVAAQSLRNAQDRLGTAAGRIEWLVEDVLTFRPWRQYTLWHDRAVFHFLTDEADRAAYLETVDHAVVPGGYVAIATFAADGPEECSGLPVQRYSSSLLSEALAPVCSPLGFEHEVHVAPSGEEQHFLYGQFRKVSG